MILNSQDGFQCSQFEALLAQALDAEGDQGWAGSPAAVEGPVAAEAAAPRSEGGEAQGLDARLREAFEAHRVSCAACKASFDDARAGMLLLRAIPDVEPPKNLLHNILAATSHAGVADKPAPEGAGLQWMGRMRRNLRPALSGFLRSRFAASFGMAFFSLSLTLSLLGVNFSKLGKVDWHPSALRKSVVLQYTHIEASVMRYYDNMRLVYEVQRGVQQFRKGAASPGNENNQGPREENRKGLFPEPRQVPQQADEYDNLIARCVPSPKGARL